VILLCAACGPTSSSASRTAVSAVTFEPVDLVFDVPHTVSAPFQAPSGRTITATSFTRSGKQVVRFTPTEPGNWRYSVLAGVRTIDTGTLQVSKGSAHGFIRARAGSLAYEDGTLFVALGENRINLYDSSWNWRRLPASEYLEHMAKHGMSTLRLFIVSDVENEATGGRNLGVLEPAVGQFDETVAAQFDDIFRAAQARGIQIVLVAFALGFSEADDWKSWQDNPYSRERGGSAGSRFDFFDSPTVRAQAAARIRYLAARYAAFPNLLAIDLLNEPEWDGGIPEVAWTPWAESMSREWDAADPYDHPVTVGSVGLHWNIEGDEREWWKSRECQIVQWHLYGKEVYEVHALAAEMTRKVREVRDYGKPVLVGEFAFGGEAKPEYDHTHVGLWSASFSGAGVLAHSAPPFNVDSDELMTPERAHHYGVLKRTLSALPALDTWAVNATEGASAWVLGSATTRAVWLLAPKKNYGTPISQVRISMRDVPDGLWRIEWFDDVSGALLGSTAMQASEGMLELVAPPFARHVVGVTSSATKPSLPSAR
jgi:Cellulase (glycosyl hydrolase family 5)